VLTDAEWTILEYCLIARGFNYVGTTAGNKYAKSLASTTNWFSSISAAVIGNGLTKNTQQNQFFYLTGGYRYYVATFYNLHNYSY
jgi:hypothetical protein